VLFPWRHHRREICLHAVQTYIEPAPSRGLATRGLRRYGGEVKAAAITGAGVGMLGRGHHAVGGAGLDDIAVLLDQDLVRQCADNRRSWPCLRPKSL